jgi:hypothetical protein
MSQPTKPFPEVWRPIERELRAYYREMPRLLREGGQNKFVVVRGEETDKVWDTYGEATEYAHETYRDGKFIIQPINKKLMIQLSDYLEPTSHQYQEVA